MTDDNNLCKQHSGFKARIEKLEDNVSALWAKWDSMQKLVIGILVTMCLNLIGVLFIILRSAFK